MRKIIMSKFIFASLVLAGFLAGCATSNTPDVVTHYDRFTGFRTDIIPDNLLEVTGDVREVVWLNASRVFKDQQDFDYYLEVHYEARAETGLINIAPGTSLVLVADSKEIKLKGSGSLNTHKSRGELVSEDALYNVSADELRAIANAQKVKVKIIGRNGLVERDFTPINFQKFKKFVTNYVDGGS